MALVCDFCVPCQCFLQYTGWHFNPAKKYMLCKYTCTSGEGSWPKTGVEDGTETQNKPEKRRGGRGRTGTRRERAGGGTCAQLQRQREKQGRGTIVGRVMAWWGTVEAGGRKVDRKWGSWKHQENDRGVRSLSQRSRGREEWGPWEVQDGDSRGWAVCYARRAFCSMVLAHCYPR